MTKIIQPPILETARLFLHPIRLDDAPSLQKHFNNWNVIKYLNDKVPWPYPDDGAYQFLKNNALPRMEAGKAMLWGIFPKENQQAAIGLVEFRAEKTANDQEDRGFWIAQAYWGQGLMSEAVNAVNDFIFFDYGRDKITLQNYKMNIGSRRVKEKTGATFLHTKTENWRGEKREVEVWELTAENWKKFREEKL